MATRSNVLTLLQRSHVLIAVIVGLVLCGAHDPAWAGPAEEVAQLAAKRGLAFAQGNLDTFIEDFAADAVFTSSLAGFRFEGKPAISAYYGGLFQDYPNRRSLVRHSLTHVYGDHTVVANSYTDLTLIDRSGQVKTVANRSSTTWVRIDGRWQIVNQHFSPMPGTR
jgi:uncharacterized protein (TIGR02246 family)